MEKPKRDSSAGGRDQNSMFWAVILIGLGVVFLLGNVINWNLLWPLLLIGLGVYLIFGRGRSLGGYFAPAERRTDRFVEPVDGAEAARVRLDLSIGENKVGPLTDPGILFDAEVTYVGEMDFTVSGDVEKIVRLRQNSSTSFSGWLNPANWFGNLSDLRWDARLNPNVPTELEIHGGVGKAMLDLRPLRLTGLRISGGVGEVNVTLPEQRADYETRINGGTGEIKIDVPSGASGNIYVKAGVGEVRVRVPEDAAVRVSAQGGIGDVKVASRFTQISGGDSNFGIGKSGVWETPGFASADRRIVLDVEGGVGSVSVR